MPLWIGQGCMLIFFRPLVKSTILPSWKPRLSLLQRKGSESIATPYVLTQYTKLLSWLNSQAQGRLWKVTSTLIWSLSPRDVSTNSSGLTYVHTIYRIVEPCQHHLTQCKMTTALETNGDWHSLYMYVYGWSPFSISSFPNVLEAFF